jgi:hypothetical protein
MVFGVGMYQASQANLVLLWDPSCKLGTLKKKERVRETKLTTTDRKGLGGGRGGWGGIESKRRRGTDRTGAFVCEEREGRERLDS